MSTPLVQDLVHQYYKAWAAQNQSKVRTQLHDNLKFRSPQDHFKSADSFLSACWKYALGLTGVGFITEIYNDDQAFVILRWELEDGGYFAGAEYLKIESGVIKEILVVNNDPRFVVLFS